MSDVRDPQEGGLIGPVEKLAHASPKTAVHTGEEANGREWSQPHKLLISPNNHKKRLSYAFHPSQRLLRSTRGVLSNLLWHGQVFETFNKNTHGPAKT